MEDIFSVQAIRTGNMFLCGKCKKPIAEKRGLERVLGNGYIYVKCPHHEKGKGYCKTKNEIEV